jgi:hypothetical protein
MKSGVGRVRIGAAASLETLVMFGDVLPVPIQRHIAEDGLL